MAQFNENIKIAAPNPIDYKYMSTRTSAGRQLPYSGTSEVISIIPEFERHTGLTVNILGEEYWFRTGVTDTSLEPKLLGGATAEGTITGATNLGSFTGTTAIQQIRLTTSSGFQPISGTRFDYGGDYFSVFNYYYRDADGFIRVGISATSGVPLRAYVKTNSPIKSWIWSDSTSGDEQIGWNLIDGNAELLVGQQVAVANYYSGEVPFTNFEWIEGINHNTISGISLSVNDVVGDLDSGAPLIAGGPVYAETLLSGTTLGLRTIRSMSPEAFTITYDDTFINISSVATKIITGATNGLSVPTTGNINVIGLGGSLCRDTVINGSSYVYSLSATSLNTLYLNAECGILANNVALKPYEYADDYFLFNYNARSIPDVAFVTGYTQNSPLVKKISNVGTSYTAQSSDFYIGASGGSAINLPNTLPNGMVITVADNCGNASLSPLNPVMISVSPSFFFGGDSSICITTAFGSMSFIYNCERNRWGVLAFNPAAV